MKKKDLVFQPCEIRFELKSSPCKTNVLRTKLSVRFINAEMLQIISIGVVFFPKKIFGCDCVCES